MKNIVMLLLAGFYFCSLVANAQSNNYPSTPVPVNADPVSTPPPVQNQNAPVTPPRGTEPNNKVMLKAQTDSMDSKRKTAPPTVQKIYRDSTRYMVHPGDTATGR